MGQDPNLGLTVFLPAENLGWRVPLILCTIPQRSKRATEAGLHRGDRNHR